MLKEWSRDLALALEFLTRLPITLRGYSDAAERTRALRAYPLAGLLIGLAGGAIYALAIWVSLPPLVSALLALATMMKLTGALHEDGLADMSDALGAPVERARRLEIMHDSRIGTAGALALIVTVAVKAAALAELAEIEEVVAALIIAAAASRAVLSLAAFFTTPARSDGLGAAMGEPSGAVVLWACGLAVLISLLFSSFGFTFALLGLIALYCLVFLIVVRKVFGGYTGDTMGALQQTVDVLVLLTAAAW
ncbi:adenosylcobinamide-GDP ribazoletransferase [Fodinicurvata halophila]|uniref:Adenosylcobinamide-GDP ribazoletransferase n=1 Tax=Fodinicurvata halophila TaxID=1419723 RepID=A0ABV8UMY6_9PROT